MANYDNEKAEIIEWLKHPNELGKAPHKIEFVKEFTDKEGIHCLIFRFKAGLLSPWLMAIYSDSGIFSEQEKYDEKNDVEQASRMVEYLKQYWKSIAMNEEEKKIRAQKAENFHAFVLKKEAKFQPEMFLKMFQENWGEALEEAKDDGTATEEREGTDARIYCNREGIRLIFGYMDFPVPDNEAVENAKYNYMWQDGAAVTETHTAHEIVFVSGGESVSARAMFYSKVISVLCKMENNIGLYANGTVYEPAMIVKMCELVKEGRLPLPALVWCGLGNEEKGISAWTDGMKCFGFDEMEIIGANKKPSELQGLMLLLADYCIGNDIGFHDGETVGLIAGLQIQVEKSKGYNVDEEGETLKLIME